LVLVPSIASAEGWVDVPCTINNKPIVLKYDSGAQLSAIGINVAKTLNIPRTAIVGSIPAQGAAGQITNTPLAEVALSIAGAQPFRTRVLLDNQGWFNGLLGRNDLNTTHSICFGANNLVQLYPFPTARKIASSSPAAYINGTVNGVATNFLFDTGAVGASASTSISSQLAQSAGVTSYVATATEQTFQGMMASGGIANVTLTLNGSQPFQTLVNVDPVQSTPGLVSRQDVTRVFRACMGPTGLSLTPLSQPAITQRRPPSGRPTPHPQAPETSPQPSKLTPVPSSSMMMAGFGLNSGTLVLVGFGVVGLIGLFMVFRR
jgi:predicted aspartyl protease